MDYVYEDERIPLQIRRLLIFDEICKLAKKQPDEIIHLSRFTELSLGVMYLKDFKRFIAFGGMFEYAHTRDEVIEQAINVIPNDEMVMCALTVNLIPFTKPARNALQLLWQWNNYVCNRLHAYIDYREEHFFKVNDEIDWEYPAHKFHQRLIATARLPLWDDRDELIADVYRDKTGKPRPERYNEKRLV